MSGHRAPRRDLRDRAAPRRLLGGGGRRARARRRLDARGGARGLERRGGQPLRAARRRARLGGLASRQRPDRPAASTARSASSPRSRRPTRLPDAPLAVVAFRAEESGPMGSKRLDARRPTRTSSCTSSRARCSRSSASRSASSPRSPARRAASGVFEGRADHAGTTPMDAREDALVEAARFVLHVRDCARDGDGRDRRRRSRSSRTRRNVVPARVTVSRRRALAPTPGCSTR